VFFRSKFSNTFNCWYAWKREITLLQVELIFHGPMLPSIRCSGPITKAQNLKSFSTNQAKQNRVDRPPALTGSRCSGMSVLHPSYYRKSSEYVNGHARRQQTSPSRDWSKSGHQLRGSKRLEVQHYQIRCTIQPSALKSLCTCYRVL